MTDHTAPTSSRFQRLDWPLLRPARPLEPRSRQLRAPRLQRQIDQVETKIEALVQEARRRVLQEGEVDKLADLEDRLDGMTLAACEAAHAPRIEDDPDWENRLVEEFEHADTDMELDEFLDFRRKEFDCDRCPFAAFYSLYPQDPCEMSVGPLLVALASSTELVDSLRQPMGPDDMRALADSLEAVLTTGSYRPLAELDAGDLIAKAIEYLRFWGRLGFGIHPELVDEEVAIQTPDGPIGPPSTGPSSLLH